MTHGCLGARLDVAMVIGTRRVGVTCFQGGMQSCDLPRAFGDFLGYLFEDFAGVSDLSPILSLLLERVAYLQTTTPTRSGQIIALVASIWHQLDQMSECLRVLCFIEMQKIHL